ncbi:MAG: hypothetical protein CVV34_00455 [Methanomicrobiales archaeon HGW-Methanomicrobiales-5]|nr:MAG: hypothetical protein CVV34_00455 [Methanomicrobiales archaeon HGW-Methanomicrobiales-5]
MSTINSDEHDAKHGVRSVREQPLAPEQRDKPGACGIPTINRQKNKGGDVKRAGVQRAPASGMRTSEHDRPISYQLCANIFL